MTVSALDTFISDNLWLVLLLVAWTLPWKGVALWRAVKRGDLGWFVVILMFNTVAILEIFYIFFIAAKPKKVVQNQ